MRIAVCVMMIVLCAPFSWGQAITGFSDGSEYVIYYGDSTGDVIGYRFLVNEAVEVTHLGVWNKDNVLSFEGMTTSKEVGIWDSSQTLLSSGIVTPADGAVGDWTYTPVTPHTLVPGETYTIGALYTALDNDAYISSVSAVTTAAEVTWINAAFPFETSLGLVFPTEDSSASSIGRFGPNFIADGLFFDGFEGMDVSAWSAADGFTPNSLTLADAQGFDFSEQTAGDVTHGDFYFFYQAGVTRFWANNAGMRGVVDLGVVPGELWEVTVPSSGYSQAGVEAISGHTYVSLAADGEEDFYIIFKVQALSTVSTTIDWIYVYRP